MTKTTTKKKPNAFDLTRRNLVAMKKRIAVLETRVSQLRALWEDWHRDVSTHQHVSPVTNPLNDNDPPTEPL